MIFSSRRRIWAIDRLCEMDGARWVYDNDELGAIRRDVMTILIHHAASRQAAIALYGKMRLPAKPGEPTDGGPARKEDFYRYSAPRSWRLL
jgi:hypothetical protein